MYLRCPAQKRREHAYRLRKWGKHNRALTHRGAQPLGSGMTCLAWHYATEPCRTLRVADMLSRRLLNLVCRPPI